MIKHSFPAANVIHYWRSLYKKLYDEERAWKRKIMRAKETEGGSFTFNYSIAHCVGDGRKRKKER